MSVSIRLFFALAAGLFAATATAHEFWLLPDRFAAPVGATVRLRMFVGEQFAGDQVGFYTTLVSGAHHYTSGGDSDLGAAVPAAPIGDFPIALRTPGTHLIAIDSHPSQIELEAGRFQAYLHDEGLDYVVKAREAAGTASTPGRERYRRNIKTLVTAGTPGASGDRVFSRITGQRMEIVPQSDPQLLAAGQDLRVQVLFDGKPLANALVKFWHRRGSQSLLVRTVTDDEGKAAFTPPWPGTWMASVVHMIPATDAPDVDWDSYWANLTFALPRR